MKLQHLTTIKTLTAGQITHLFSMADECMTLPANNEILKNKLLGIMFFQPSTRTRISFESAMLRLGGQVTGFQDLKSTRGGDYYQESFSDMVRVLAGMTDGIVIRHFINSAAELASELTNVPIINAGDGTNEHPTQVLTDAWVMQRLLGSLTGKVIALAGELENRAYHSFVHLFGKIKIKKLLFLPPPGKHVTPAMKQSLFDNNILWEERDDIHDVLVEADLIEMVPMYLPDYNLSFGVPDSKKKILPDQYVLDLKKFEKVKRYIPVLHPGPRMSELATNIDNLPNFFYFKQSQLSVFMRMAILRHLFDNTTYFQKFTTEVKPCVNNLLIS